MAVKNEFVVQLMVFLFALLFPKFKRLNFFKIRIDLGSQEYILVKDLFHKTLMELPVFIFDKLVAFVAFDF